MSSFEVLAPQSVLPVATSSTPRRESRHHFVDHDRYSPQLYSPHLNGLPPPRSTPRPQNTPTLQWHFPTYDKGPPRQTEETKSIEEFPSRRVSQIPIGPNDVRRDSGESDATLQDYGQTKIDPYKKYSLSSYEHPFDIPPPQDAYPGPGQDQSATRPRPLRSALRRSVSFAEAAHVREYVPSDEEVPVDKKTERALKRRGVLSNMMDLYAINHSLEPRVDKLGMSRRTSDANSEDYPTAYSSARPNMRHADSMASMMSMGSDMLDPDDPRVTGVEAEYLEDHEDLEKNALRQMDYRSRRKHLMRIKIEFNVTCTSFLV